MPSMMTLLLACISPPSPELPAGRYRAYGSDLDTLMRCAAPAPSEVTLAYAAPLSRLRLATREGAYVSAATGPDRWQWLGLDEPVDPRLSQKAREEQPGDDCAPFWFMPFRSGGYVFIIESMTYVANPDTFGFRQLDNGMLENCEITRADVLHCLLDLSWESASFDAEGRPVGGSFQPFWMY